MCGICGVWEWKQSAGRAEEDVRRMAAALRHRGPDEEGFRQADGVHLGHRRLKVIDLTSGRQPMVSDDGRYALTFNGEIYNYRAIRADLEKLGRRFTSSSDTESLLRLYEEKGDSALPVLEGMFAFAVYDRREKKMTLAVDPFGKKPLYYYRDENVFLFASEIKALWTHPAVSKKMDAEALSQYLCFEYVPAPKTLFHGISKLEAGTALTVTADGRTRLDRYHRHVWASDPKPQGQWLSEAGELFLDAVEKRLVSDVPLGIFLSGGVDSSAVLWAACHLLPGKKIKTFTIEFDDPSFDEGPHARAMSDHFGTEHFTERCSAQAMLDEHQTILSTLDEPLADASYLPTYMLCRMARRHVTVALSGDGGDEVFCGYPTFQAAKMAQSMDAWPGWLKRGLGIAVERLPVSMKNMSFDFKAKQFLKGLLADKSLRDQIWLGAFSPEESLRVLSTEYKKYAAAGLRPLKEHVFCPESDSLQRLQEFYFNFYLQGDILVKTDRASMAHALEVRSPLLDDRLVRMVNRMPSKWKMENGKLKFFLKRYLQGKLPDAVLRRPKKGFGIPVARWIRSELKENFRRELSRERLASEGIFDPAAVENLLNEHWRGRHDHRKKLWTIYAFQQWKKHWLS